jgi:CRP/FNR family cyclic AMP-dependent transcriptional regulator
MPAILAACRAAWVSAHVQPAGGPCRGYDVPVMQGSFPVEALRSCRLFAGTSQESLAGISRTLRARKFRRGEVLFHEGDPGDSLFIVVSGSVKVVVPSDQGDEAILATLGPGDSLGELSLLDGVPRSASAIAIEPVEALMLPRQQFLSLLATDANLRAAVLGHLAAELRRLTTHVADLHFLDLTGRLAARLARLAEERGERDPDGSVRLDAPPTQGDLASMVGATRQSVNKLLGEFAQEGLIRLESDAIVIPDMEALAARSRR